MARHARIVVPHYPHHLTQRGNNHSDVFADDADRETYLEIIRRQSAKYELEILGYCLMTNHVHLVAIPHTESALARAFGTTNFTYTQYVNKRSGRSGHLWQNRYYSIVLDQEYFWKALRYVERNPVRAGICARAVDYRWSSARAHALREDEFALLDLNKWAGMSPLVNWGNALLEETDPVFREQLYRRYRSGRPLGSPEFIDSIAQTLGRDEFIPAPVGRPKIRDRH